MQFRSLKAIKGSTMVAKIIIFEKLVANQIYRKNTVEYTFISVKRVQVYPRLPWHFFSATQDKLQPYIKEVEFIISKQMWEQYYKHTYLVYNCSLWVPKIVKIKWKPTCMLVQNCLRCLSLTSTFTRQVSCQYTCMLTKLSCCSF